MAVTLSGLGTTQRITLSSTANNVTEVILPPFANMLEVQFIANDGKIAITGTDGAAIGSNFFTASADTLYRREVFYRAGDTAAQKRYLASATSSCVVEVTPLRSSLLVAGEAGGGGGGGGGGVSDLQGAYDGGASITTAGAVPLVLNLADGSFLVNGGSGVGTVHLGATTDLASFTVQSSTVTITGATSTTVELAANSGSPATYTINVANSGVGDADLDVNVDNSITIDGGSFSIDATGASNVSTTAANLTLSTLTSGTLALSSAGDLTASDGNKSGSTYSGAFKLSGGSSEWSTFETNFGEVSLLNAINKAYRGIVQVVSATYSTEVTVATTTYTDTGLTATITPTSANNKIIVQVQIAYNASRGGGTGIAMKVLRDAVVIEESWGQGNTGATDYRSAYWAFTGSTGGNIYDYWICSVVDSPASTSALTYKVQGRPSITSNSGQVVFQVAASGVGGVAQVSRILLMEVAP